MSDAQTAAILADESTRAQQQKEDPPMKRWSSYLVALEKHRLLIHEDAFRDQVAFWDMPSIDCTANSFAAERSIVELKKIGDETIKDLRYYSPLESLDLKKTSALLGRFTDPRTGVLRQNEDTLPDAASVDQGFRIIFRDTSYGRDDKSAMGSLAQKEMPKLFKQCSSFLGKCLVSAESGVYGNTPWSPPSIGATFSCLTVFCALHEHGLEDLIPLESSSRFQLLRDTIVETYMRVTDSKVAFANLQGGPGHLCATYYATRILTFLEQSDEVLRQIVPPTGILKYLGACKTKDLCAYGEDPGQPNLIHTRYALLIMRRLLDRFLVNPGELEPIVEPAARIVKYVNSCHHDDGYGVMPGVAPTVYSTRAAIKIVKSLKLLENNGVFAATPEYAKGMEEFYRKVEGIRKFLTRCSDEKGAYAGIPLT